MRQQ
jgi:hypothetical protein